MHATLSPVFQRKAFRFRTFIVRLLLFLSRSQSRLPSSPAWFALFNVFCVFSVGIMVRFAVPCPPCIPFFSRISPASFFRTFFYRSLIKRLSPIFLLLLWRLSVAKAQAILLEIYRSCHPCTFFQRRMLVVNDTRFLFHLFR